MRQGFDKRLRQLEASNPVNKKPDFSHVSPDDLRKWKEILTAATDSGDGSSYYDELAVHAPTVYAAYLKAAQQ